MSRHLTAYYGCFSDYDDETLKDRIAYWEDAQAQAARRFESLDFGVLQLLYAERDARVERQLLAWVERK